MMGKILLSLPVGDLHRTFPWDLDSAEEESVEKKRRGINRNDQGDRQENKPKSSNDKSGARFSIKITWI